MVSRVFNSYSEEEKRRIIKKLLEVQDRKCLFCDKPINYSDDVTLDEFLKHHEVDHIKPLTEKNSRDDDSNWAILHKECNRKKGARPLFLAKRIYKFQKDREKFGEKFTLGKVLEIYNIQPKPLFLKLEEDYATIKYEENNIEKEINSLNNIGSYSNVYAYLTLPQEVPVHTPCGLEASKGRKARLLSKHFYSLPLTCLFKGALTVPDDTNRSSLRGTLVL